MSGEEYVVEAMFPYSAAEKNQLSLHPPEEVVVLERDESGWWIGRNADGQVGIFPSTYVRDKRTEKVFNKPKVHKMMIPTTTEPQAERRLTREEKLAADLGLVGDDADVDEDDDPIALVDEGEYHQLQQDCAQLRAKLVATQNERDLAWARMQEYDAEAAECRKQTEEAKAELNVLKKAGAIHREKERRLQYEVQELTEMTKTGKATDRSYECVPDEAIEKYLATALTALRQDHEELEKSHAQLLEQQKDAQNRENASNGVAKEPVSPEMASPEKEEKEKEKKEKGEDAPADAAAADANKEQYEKLKTKYKKLEKVYHKLKAENAELKSKGDAEEPVAPESAVTGELAAKLEQLKKELKAKDAALEEEHRKMEGAVDAKGREEELKTKMKKLDSKRKKEIEGLKQDMEPLRAELDSVNTTAEESSTKAVELQAELDKIVAARNTEAEELASLQAVVAESDKKLAAAIAERTQQYDELMKRYMKEEKRRKALFDELQELTQAQEAEAPS